jgi:AcrR family transcriptional regulator
MASETEPASSGLSGRRGEAARNDERILAAARAVFTGDPGAPIAAVAERAGVGIGALYRRYRSKDELLQRLSLDGLERYIAAAEAGLADRGDPWTAFTSFMRRCVEAGSGSLTMRFAGTFRATQEQYHAGRRAHELTQRLIERLKAAGALRADIEVGDLSLIFEQLQAIKVGDEARAGQLRYRYLTLFLQAMRSPAEGPLPGPPPQWDELTRRYDI